jgi:hypothetical protein
LSEPRDGASGWLVLLHQFPRRPGSLRVKVWRRLQSIGAIAIKQSVYVLPDSDPSREDFAWLLREIVAGGAEGAILEARFLDGLDDGEVRSLFNQARDEDYSALAADAREALDRMTEDGVLDERALHAARESLSRIKRRLNEIEAIDFFGADARGEAQGLVATLTDRLARRETIPIREDATMGSASIESLEGRVWVTRRGVKVDRMASAWLIRRWIDPRAVFKFTPEKNYEAGEGEVRFDMFEAEFTHEGELCTFEVLLRRAALDDPALRRIAEIVHDIDLKDDRYAHEETPGVATLLTGITVATADDHQRIERGNALFEALYSSFREAAGRGRERR